MSLKKLEQTFRRCARGRISSAESAAAPAPLEMAVRNTTSPEAMAAIDVFVTWALTRGVDGLRADFEKVRGYVTAATETAGAFVTNTNRNRYRDVVCIDSSRVVLTLNGRFVFANFRSQVSILPLFFSAARNWRVQMAFFFRARVDGDANFSDYIHANWIRLEGVDRTYIAAQGPLESTTSDFWYANVRRAAAVAIAASSGASSIRRASRRSSCSVNVSRTIATNVSPIGRSSRATSCNAARCPSLILA